MMTDPSAPDSDALVREIANLTDKLSSASSSTSASIAREIRSKSEQLAMISKVSDAALFDQFVDRVTARAAGELHLDVLRHPTSPYKIMWGRFENPYVYYFDATVARKVGVERLVDAALETIRSNMPR